MAQEPEALEDVPPQGHVRVVYLGPVAPHWEVHGIFGDRIVVDEFRQRAMARLQLLPPHHAIALPLPRWLHQPSAIWDRPALCTHRNSTTGWSAGEWCSMSGMAASRQVDSAWSCGTTTSSTGRSGCKYLARTVAPRPP